MTTTGEKQKSDYQLGEMVELLYDEVAKLQLTGPEKSFLVAIMLADIMQKCGRTISFQLPPLLPVSPKKPARAMAG